MPRFKGSGPVVYLGGMSEATSAALVKVAASEHRSVGKQILAMVDEGLHRRGALGGK